MPSSVNGKPTPNFSDLPVFFFLIDLILAVPLFDQIHTHTTWLVYHMSCNCFANVQFAHLLVKEHGWQIHVLAFLSGSRNSFRFTCLLIMMNNCNLVNVWNVTIGSQGKPIVTVCLKLLLLLKFM